MKTPSTATTRVLQPCETRLAALLISRTPGRQWSVPVTGGVCVPRGVLHDVSAMCLEAFGTTLTAQSEVLNRWSDGSIRWLLVSVVLPDVPGQPQVQKPVIPVHRTGSDRSEPSGSQSDRSRDGGAASDSTPTGIPVELVFLSQPGDSGDRRSRAQQPEHTVVKYDAGRIMIRSQSYDARQPLEQTVWLTPELKDCSGRVLSLRSVEVRSETAGDVRQVFVVTVAMESDPRITLQVRITRWSGTGLMKADVRIRNSRRARHAGGLWDLGDPGSFLFGSLQLKIRSDAVDPSASSRWKCDRRTAWSECRGDQTTSIRQSGSGAPDCDTSRIAAGAVQFHEPVGQPAGDAGEHGYVVHHPTGRTSGNRAEPTVAVGDLQASLAVACPEFWQQYPASLEFGHGVITAGLFPAGPFPAGPFPADAGMAYELQGGEQKTHSLWIATGRQSGGRPELDWTFAPPLLLQSPAAYHAAEVFPWYPAVASPGGLIPADRAADPSSGTAVSRLHEYLTAATTGEFSLPARREKIREYGWRDYGEIPADHEQLHFPGPGVVVSHYNNQFDMILGGLLQLAATSDPRWHELSAPLARHVMDIDIYHTDEDRAVFNGGMFWHTDHYVDAATSTHRTYSRRNRKPGESYGGGPSCEHNYPTGLLHYYFLTGDPEARDSVVSLAEWVIHMDDGRQTIWGLLDDGPTGRASATVYPDFHGPGRGPGNSINALLDGWLLTGQERFSEKAAELIRRCVHPSQDIDALQLTNAEERWSYTVFLTSLARYLLIRLEAGRLDEMYTYARQVMSHYGRWMVEHERRTLSRPEELKYPTEAWAAQDLRKANVLRLTAACEDDPVRAAAMRTMADRLSDEAWADLETSGAARLNARCLSIVMTEGQRDLFHRSDPELRIPPGQVALPQSQWSMFVPQKVRVRRLLRSPRGLVSGAVRALSPRLWQQTWRALKREL